MIDLLGDDWGTPPVSPSHYTPPLRPSLSVALPPRGSSDRECALPHCHRSPHCHRRLLCHRGIGAVWRENSCNADFCLPARTLAALRQVRTRPLARARPASLRPLEQGCRAARDHEGFGPTEDAFLLLADAPPSQVTFRTPLLLEARWVCVAGADGVRMQRDCTQIPKRAERRAYSPHAMRRLRHEGTLAEWTTSGARFPT